MVDAGGNKVAETRYFPFGEERYTDGTSPTDKTYTGQRSEDFGLMDYNARYYSPLLGKFISADTIIPDPGNVLAWDRYGYVLNNPIRYSDPSEHCIELQDGLCVRTTSDNSYRIVQGGNVFPNYVEVALANYFISEDTSSLNSIPDGAYASLGRSISAAGSQMGYS